MVHSKVDELKFSASAKNSLNALGIIHLLRGDLTLARERLDHAFKLQDNISKSGFGDGAIDELAMWDKYINDTLKPYFLGAFSKYKYDSTILRPSSCNVVEYRPAVLISQFLVHMHTLGLKD